MWVRDSVTTLCMSWSFQRGKFLNTCVGMYGWSPNSWGVAESRTTCCRMGQHLKTNQVQQILFKNYWRRACFQTGTQGCSEILCEAEQLWSVTRGDGVVVGSSEALPKISSSRICFEVANFGWCLFRGEEVWCWLAKNVLEKGILQVTSEWAK